MNRPDTPRDLAHAGYRIHLGGPDDDDLAGRFWWTQTLPDWSGIDTSDGDWATADEAIADAHRDSAHNPVEPTDAPDDTPSLEDGRDNCNDAGTGEGRYHGRM